MPIHLRKAVTRINGTDKVESVTMSKVTADGEIIPNTEETIDVDFVCIAGGLYPLGELAAVANCPFRYVEELGGHVPVHNEQMETPIEGLYVAGNITGVESAQVASAQGTGPGLSLAQNEIDRPEIKDRLTRAMENVRRERKSTRLNSSHVAISYAVFCLKKKR